MDWTRLYAALEADPGLLKKPRNVQLLEARLQQIEMAQDLLEQEALRCDELLDMSDALCGDFPRGG